MAAANDFGRRGAQASEAGPDAGDPVASRLIWSMVSQICSAKGQVLRRAHWLGHDRKRR